MTMYFVKEPQETYNGSLVVALFGTGGQIPLGKWRVIYKGENQATAVQMAKEPGRTVTSYRPHQGERKVTVSDYHYPDGGHVLPEDYTNAMSLTRDNMSAMLLDAGIMPETITHVLPTEDEMSAMTYLLRQKMRFSDNRDFEDIFGQFTSEEVEYLGLLGQPDKTPASDTA